MHDNQHACPMELCIMATCIASCHMFTLPGTSMHVLTAPLWLHACPQGMMESVFKRLVGHLDQLNDRHAADLLSALTQLVPRAVLRLPDEFVNSMKSQLPELLAMSPPDNLSRCLVALHDLGMPIQTWMTPHWLAQHVLPHAVR